MPDWSQFATKQDLAELESRLLRWLVGIFVGSVTVVGGSATGFLKAIGDLGPDASAV